MSESGILTNNKTVRYKVQLSVKNLYSVFVALLPVIMIYNVPIVNMGLSTVLLGVFLPYTLYCICRNLKITLTSLVLIIFFGYFLFRSTDNSTTLITLIAAAFHVLAAFNDSLDYRIVRKTIELIAIISSALVLIQTLMHYLFGVNIIWLIKDLVLEANQDDITIISTGMYRPSAIFLEPSHYAQYCTLAILSVLFPLKPNQANIKEAVWIAFGCILTTSGMGIVLCIGIFGWYMLFNKKRAGKKLTSAIMLIIGGVAAFIVLMQFEFFNDAVTRIFGTVEGYNAIWGRTLYWDMYIGSMNGQNLLLGFGLSDVPDVYMTGLMEVIYSYGCLGAGLIAAVNVCLGFYSKNNFSVCCCVIYLGLLFIANLFSFISITFWLSLIISGGLYNKRATRSAE